MTNAIATLLIYLIRFGKLLSRKSYTILSQLDVALGNRYYVHQHNGRVLARAESYDMRAEPDEEYYANRYFEYILPQLDSRLIPGTKIIDLGCGQGRMISRFLEQSEFSHVQFIGVDFSKSVIEKARKFFNDRQNVLFVDNDVIEYLDRTEDDSLEFVLALEFVYMLHDKERFFHLLSKKLKKGGLAFISVRSVVYYSQFLVRNGLFDEVEKLINCDFGPIFGSSVIANWEKEKDIQQRYKNNYNLDISHVRGIGSCSGISGDPMGAVRPSLLSKQDQKKLSLIEDYVGQAHPFTGRYILFTATKS